MEQGGITRVRSLKRLAIQRVISTHRGDSRALPRRGKVSKSRNSREHRLRGAFGDGLGESGRLDAAICAAVGARPGIPDHPLLGPGMSEDRVTSLRSGQTGTPVRDGSDRFRRFGRALPTPVIRGKERSAVLRWRADVGESNPYGRASRKKVTVRLSAPR